MLDEEIRKEILQCLRKENLYKVILFGSHAYGTPGADSDIDLLIVSERKGMSKSYKDYIRNKSTISKKLLGIRRKYPLDLLVYTKDEWDLLKSLKTSFIRDIEEKGVNLL